MTLSPESIEAFRSTLTKQRQWVLLLIVAGDAVSFVALAWLLLASGEPNAISILVAIALVLPLGLALAAFGIRVSTRRMVNFVNAMAPRVNLVIPSTRQGPMLILDNGLVLRFQPTTAFRLFLSSTGDPVTPNLEEAKRWIATIRLRRVLSVSVRGGDPSLRAAVDAINSRLGTRWARLDVFDRTRVDPSQPNSPTRDAQATFFLRNVWKSASALLGEVDSIRELLVQAASAAPRQSPLSIR
jgi:hypothetical protein